MREDWYLRAMMALHRYCSTATQKCICFSFKSSILQCFRTKFTKQKSLFCEIYSWSTADLPLVTISCSGYLICRYPYVFATCKLICKSSHYCFHFSTFGSLKKASCYANVLIQTKEALNFLRLPLGVWNTCANALKEKLLQVQITEEKMQSIRGRWDFLSNWISLLFVRYGMFWRKSPSATTEGTRAGYWVSSGHQWIQILFIQEQMTFQFTNGRSQSRSIHGLLRVSTFKQKTLFGSWSWEIAGCHVEMVW